MNTNFTENLVNNNLLYLANIKLKSFDLILTNNVFDRNYGDSYDIFIENDINDNSTFLKRSIFIDKLTKYTS